MSVADNLRRVLSEMERYQGLVGRSDVRLVAVTKTIPPQRIREAYDAGQRVFGENRVQEGVGKISELTSLMPEAEWHLIGHLQSNKAKLAIEWFSVIQTVDSLELAGRLDRLARGGFSGGISRHGSGSSSGNGTKLPMLAEVNITGEASKSGFSPAELRAAFSQLLSLDSLEWRGLMTIPPLTADPEDARWVFRALRALRDEMRERHELGSFTELSMGMSGDYPVAIAEGATMVRIGTAIFGARAAVRRTHQ
jgi:pyridoxal phosphate enzyme (YggS family)